MIFKQETKNTKKGFWTCKIFWQKIQTSWHKQKRWSKWKTSSSKWLYSL